MVVIKMWGGLGNQMFQYALGFALKKKTGKEVLFDTSYYNYQSQIGFTNRDLEVQIFPLTYFKHSDKKTLKKTLLAKSIRFMQRHLLAYQNRNYIVEQFYGYDKNIFGVKRNVYLEGFWQSPKYFNGIEHSLKKEFCFKEKLSPNAASFFNLIKSTECSISIHVRRGDYLTLYKSLYTVQNPQYYYDGVNYVVSHLDHCNITLFVFSEDIEWCKKSLNFQQKTIFVDSVGMHSYEDMVLMSKCNHHIIANSSYSWWGAWLNQNTDKIVVGPKKWFSNEDTNKRFVSDLFPSSWIVI